MTRVALTVRQKAAYEVDRDLANLKGQLHDRKLWLKAAEETGLDVRTLQRLINNGNIGYLPLKVCEMVIQEDIEHELA